MDKKLTVTTLSNGLRVGLMRVPEIQSICVHLRGLVGSNAEDSQHIGYAHIAEHIKVSSASCDSNFINTVQNGARFLGVTSRDDVLFGIKCLAPFFEQTLKTLASFLYQTPLDDSLLQTHKSLVTQEIQRFLDTPEELIKRIGYRGLFPNTRMQIFNTGTIENVREITAEKLSTFINNFYEPQNFVICICGNINENSVSDLVNSTFSNITNRSDNLIARLPTLSANDQHHVDVELLGNTTLDYVRLTFAGYPMANDKRYAQSLLAKLVDLILKDTLKTKGLSYKVGVSSYSSASYGIFDIGFSSNPKDTLHILDHINSTWKLIPKLAKTKLLEISKNCLYSAVIFELEKISSRTAYYSELMLHGNPKLNVAYEISQIISCGGDDVIQEWDNIVSQNPKISIVSGKLSEKERRLLSSYKLN